MHTQLLGDPKTHKSVTERGSVLITDDGKTFSISQGIPVFIAPQDVVDLNLKYQQFYDKIARFYNVFVLFYKLFSKKFEQRRKRLFQDLVIKPGMTVLETSVGTGFNISLFTKEAEYYGVDISMGMLRRCQQENRKWGYNLHLVQANAEELPFKDNSFDVVFHVGGINFFNDIPKAIHEMIRVAKPGAQIFISDETQHQVETRYKKLPFVRRFFKDVKPVKMPIEFIPPTMKSVKHFVDEKDLMYVITFFKPT